MRQRKLLRPVLTASAAAAVTLVAVSVVVASQPAPAVVVADDGVSTAPVQVPAQTGTRPAYEVQGPVAPQGSGRVTTVALDRLDIPGTALAAYQSAATVLGGVDASCRLTWPLLAAVGRVESDHGRFGGATLGADGFTHPAIRGVQLDGVGPVAKVADTDDGAVDGSRRWDRAVGPMQFLPATWATVGVDADGDGIRSADDINDAALGAAVFLCTGTGDLSTRSGARTALHRYNPSTTYADEVLAVAHAYETGDYSVPDLRVSARAVDVARVRVGTVRTPAAQHHAAHAPAPATHDVGWKQHPHLEPVTDPAPHPTPHPAPAPDPTPDPVLTELAGILTVCGTDELPAWCVDDTEVDFGDADLMAATALADFDADGTVETNADELAGLTGTQVSVEVTDPADKTGLPVVQTVGGVAYLASPPAS